MRFITVALWATLAAGMLFTRASFTLDDDRQRLRGLINELVERYQLLDNRADKPQPDPNVISLKVVFKCNYGRGESPIDFFLDYMLLSQNFQSLYPQTVGLDHTSDRYKLKKAIKDCMRGKAGLVYRFRGVERAPDTPFSTAGVQDGDEIQIETVPRITLFVDYHCGKEWVLGLEMLNVKPDGTFHFLQRGKARALAKCPTSHDVTYKVDGENIRIGDKVSSKNLQHNWVVTGWMTPLVPPPPSNPRSNP